MGGGPGRRTISNTDFPAPIATASTIPMLTPGEIPKSSALMISRFESGVKSTRTVSANAHQVHQHRRAMPCKRDRARLLAVVKVDRHLLDLETVQSSDV